MKKSKKYPKLSTVAELQKWLESPLKVGVGFKVPDMSKIDTLTLIGLNAILYCELQDRADNGKL